MSTTLGDMPDAARQVEAQVSSWILAESASERKSMMSTGTLHLSLHWLWRSGRLVHFVRDGDEEESVTSVAVSAPTISSFESLRKTSGVVKTAFYIGMLVECS